MTGEEIKALREKMKLSQEGFARRLGTSLNTVNRWEKGVHRPGQMAKTLLDQLKEKVEQGEGKVVGDR